MQEVDFMYNPYQRKLIGDMIMNTLLSVLLVINLLPVNIGARIVADETPSTDPEVQEVVDADKKNDEEKSDKDGTDNNKAMDDEGNSSDNVQNEKTVYQEEYKQIDNSPEVSKKENETLNNENGSDKEIIEGQNEQSITEEDNDEADGKEIVLSNMKKGEKAADSKEEETENKAREESENTDSKQGETGDKTQEHTRGISGIAIQMSGSEESSIPQYDVEQNNYRNNTISLTFLLYRQKDSGNKKWNITKIVSHAAEGTGIEKVTAAVDPNEKNVLYVTIEIGNSYSDGSITFTLDGHAEGSSSTSANNKKFKITIPEPQEYFVSVGDHENGSLEVDPSATSSGALINVTAQSDDEYRLRRLYYSYGEYEFDITGNSFNMPKSDVTVNAEFEKVYSVIAKEAENGSVEVTPTKAAKGETINVTANPEDNYGLKRLYFVDEEGTHDITGKNFEMPESDVEVYAEFAELFSVNISDSIRHGTVTVDKAKALAGETITVSASPSSNYRLSRLYYASGTQEYEIVENTFIMPEKDVTVYATFTRTYSVSVSGHISHGTVSVNPTRAAAGETITVTATPSNSYYLDSLYYTLGSHHTHHDITGNSFVMPESDVTVHATFVKGGYKVSISKDISNGSVSATPTRTVSGNTIIVTTIPDKGYSLYRLYYTSGSSHYHHQISGNSFAMPKSDVTIGAEFAIDTYKISYELAGGTLPEGKINPKEYNVKTQTFTLINPQRKGYTFAGWLGTDLTEASTKVTIRQGSIGNREYTATWVKDTYTISYELSGGKLPEGSENPASYDIDIAPFTLIKPQRDGYTFKGWIINGVDKGTDVTINGLNYKPAEDLTVVAAWDIIEYPIYYNNVSEAIVTNPSQYTVESEFTLNNPTKEGFDFLGWTGSNGEVPQLTVTIAEGTIGELIFNANWSKIEYDNVSSTGAEHTKGVDGDATFTFKRNVNDDEKVIIEGGALVSRTFANFVAADRVVRVDGNQIDENKFVASSGSLIIKLKKDYLDSLAAGKHELSVDFKDGDRVYTSTTHFIVRLKPADTPSFVVPTTGIHNDGSGLMRSLSMLALVAIGITIRMRNKVGKDYWDEFK